jgi:hypothetical protein
VELIIGVAKAAPIEPARNYPKSEVDVYTTVMLDGSSGTEKEKSKQGRYPVDP